MRITLYIASAIASLALVSCTRQPSVDEKLLSTYTDYVILRMTPGDSLQVKHRLDSLLLAKGYTTDSFFEQLSTYGRDRDRMREFYDSVRSRIGRMQAEISR